jgi:hypothetical protein
MLQLFLVLFEELIHQFEFGVKWFAKMEDNYRRTSGAF